MLNKCKTVLCFFALLLLVSPYQTPAGAIDNPFRAHAVQPVELSVPAYSQREDGVWQVVLALDLADGWKTYWRAPGPFGIPPSLSVVEAGNLADHGLHLPEPRLVKDPNGDFAGYRDDTAFLVELEPAKQDETVAAEFLFNFAVCADICVPRQEAVRISLAPGTGRDVPRVISLARQMPREAGFVKDVKWGEDSLIVRAQEPGDALFAESTSKTVVLSLPQPLEDGSYRFTATSGTLEAGMTLRFTLANGFGGLTEDVTLMPASP